MPALVVLAVITVVPALYLVGASLTPLSLVNPASLLDFSNPLRNYAELLHDPVPRSLVMQLQLSSPDGDAAIGGRAGAGAAAQRPCRFFEAMRTVFLIPMVLPPIVVALIWKIIYTPDISPLHRLLDFRRPASPIRCITNRAHGALGDRRGRYLAVVSLHDADDPGGAPDDAERAAGGREDRRRQPLAALLATSSCLYPAGADRGRGLFRLIDSIKAFPLIYVLTDGGPGTRDGGHQLLRLRPGLQLLLLGLCQRHRDGHAGRRLHC